RGPLDPLDHNRGHGAFPGMKFQPELVLDRGEDRWEGSSSAIGSANAARPPIPGDPWATTLSYRFGNLDPSFSCTILAGVRNGLCHTRLPTLSDLPRVGR